MNNHSYEFKGKLITIKTTTNIIITKFTFVRLILQDHYHIKTMQQFKHWIVHLIFWSTNSTYADLEFWRKEENN